MTWYAHATRYQVLKSTPSPSTRTYTIPGIEKLFMPEYKHAYQTNGNPNQGTQKVHPCTNVYGLSNRQRRAVDLFVYCVFAASSFQQHTNHSTLHEAYAIDKKNTTLNPSITQLGKR